MAGAEEETKEEVQARLRRASEHLRGAGEVKGGDEPAVGPAGAAAEAAEGAAAASRSAEGKSEGGAGWVAVPDPEGSGDSYFWNKHTGETTWDTPDGYVASDGAAAAAEPAAAAGGGAGGGGTPAESVLIYTKTKRAEWVAFLAETERTETGHDPSRYELAVHMQFYESQHGRDAAMKLLHDNVLAMDTSGADSSAPAAAVQSNAEIAAAAIAAGVAAGVMDAPPEVAAALWYYQDVSGAQQGPFPVSDMQQWYAQGFFPATTYVKRLSDPDWIPVMDAQELAAAAAEVGQGYGGYAAGAGGGFSGAADSEYAASMSFNRISGKSDDGELSQRADASASDNYRAKRQMNAFFDYDNWQDQRQQGVKKAKADKSRKKKKGVPDWYRRD